MDVSFKKCDLEINIFFMKYGVKRIPVDKLLKSLELCDVDPKTVVITAKDHKTGEMLYGY